LTFERYRELLNAGPALTASDVERLKDFRLKPAVMVFSVRWALFAMRKG
jgi:hypothetical protein